ncbi:hypothetical protein Tco_0308198 [Tanacetum coccineum]
MGVEFRNKDMDELCSRKAGKDHVDDAKPTCHFWAEAVFNTAVMFRNRNTPDSKAFRVFNKRTKKIDENLHVDFLENQPIEKGTGPNWLFDIDSLTKSMNYVPVVVAGHLLLTFQGGGEKKENVSSLRYIALPNWFHEAQMATSNDSTRNRDAFSEKGDPQNEQDRIISDTDVSESSGNTNPTAITKDPTAEQVEPVLSLIVETEVPTVSTHVPTECLSIPPVPTARTKVPTAKPTVAAVKGNMGKAVKARACWIWRPKQNQLTQGSNINGGIPQDNIDDKGYWDNGCSRHMTGNISYLSEYEPYDEGYVSFGHGGGEITGKGTIKTGKLEFENVYFVKELKYNLFSVSQIYDNKNSVLLTDSEYIRSANTSMDRENPWGKDRTGKDVELHLYRSMIRSLMYLTTSRPYIMFVVCACGRHQVTPKDCHLHAVKRIFRYLKGHPKLGLWYPKESPFDLVAYLDSDYVATSTTEAEYVAAASGCGQGLWIQNQLLDYGYNFINTKIYIDNNSAIYENVADLLTKAFDVGRFQYLVDEHVMKKSL